MTGKRLLACLSTVMLSASALAWNPLLLSGGEPVTWGGSPTVTWNPDNGPLGRLINTQANLMVSDELAKWQGVATATIGYLQGGKILDPNTMLVTDVTSANYADVIGEDNGQNPIIYDNDRDIFDMLGTPSGVVGFAGVLRTSGNTITKGYAVLQGDWFDNEPAGTAPSDPGEITAAEFRGMIVHELGHFNGLAHTSVNHEVGNLPGCPAPTLSQIETMSPFLSSDVLTLEHDDEIGISSLYPTAAFQSDFATIRGELIDRDGSSPFLGANIVLRPDTTVCDDLYDFGQAMQSGATPVAGGGSGSYIFAGLTPGSDYTILATTINDGGAYPIPPLPGLGGPDDRYNGASEDWFNPPDDPAVATAITAGAAGSTLDDVDIKINNAGNPAEVPDGPSDGLMVARFDGPLPPEDKILDDGGVNSASAFGGTAQAAWINRFTPDPAELPLQIERIDIMFWEAGSLAPGRNIRLLVYVDAAGTGLPSNATLVHTEDTTIQFLSPSSFNEYTLSSLVQVSSGEYYVGAFDLVADAPTTFIMSTDTDTASGRAYNQANSTNPGGYGLVGDRTWMVRARASTLPPAGSIQLTWGESCNISGVPDQDYGVYEGGLASLSGVPDHASIACTTGKDTSFTVISPGDDRFWLVAPVLANREGSLGTGTGGSDRTPATSCQTIAPDPCP